MQWKWQVMKYLWRFTDMRRVQFWNVTSGSDDLIKPSTLYCLGWIKLEIVVIFQLKTELQN
jgi:hypothetical protein